MIDLYHSRMSTCSQKVRLALAEAGAEWTSHIMDVARGDTRTAEYLALNPMGVVPTLVVDGRSVIESTVICEYVAEAHPQAAGMMPRDPVLRARARLWMRRLDDGLHIATAIISTAIALRHLASHMDDAQYAAHIATMPDASRRHQLMEIRQHGLATPAFVEAIGKFVGLFADMARALDAGRFLVGDEYSLADLSYIPYLLRFEHLQLGALWGQHPRLAAWFDRVRARPAYRTAVLDWFDPAYLALLETRGREAAPQVAMLAGLPANAPAPAP